MHNWKNVTAETYHDFHHDWISTIRGCLNAGLLPSGFFAMAVQIIGGPASDVVTLQDWPDAQDNSNCNEGLRAEKQHGMLCYTIKTARSAVTLGELFDDDVAELYQ